MPFPKHKPDVVYGRWHNSPEVAMDSFVAILQSAVSAGAQIKGEAHMTYADGKFIMWCMIGWSGEEPQPSRN